MSLVADSSPGFNSHRPSNNSKRPKVRVSRDFPEGCGLSASKINRGESERSVDGRNCALAIPAVPLRSVPPISVERDLENSFPSDVKHDDDNGKRKAEDNENKVRSQDKSWEHDLEKLAAVLAEAKEYLNSFDACSEALGGLMELKPKPLTETVKQEEKAGDMTLAVKRRKIECGVSKVVQEKTNSRSGDEDEVCIIPPEEWTKLHKRDVANKVKSENKCGEKDQEHNFMDSDECASVGKLEQENSNGIVAFSDININKVVKGINDPKHYDDDQRGLINMSIVKHEDPEGLKVMEILKLFKEHYEKIVKEHNAEPRGERKTAYPHLEAAERLKLEGKRIYPKKPFGHIPGVEIGDEFQFRAQLAILGLHRQLIAGIDHVIVDGKKYATSVVDSGCYENTPKMVDVLIYSGQGGNLKITDNSVDQKLEKGNLALVNSMEMKYPVRVTYKRRSHERGVVYMYDGLYMVKNAWQEHDQCGKLVFKFELHRLPGQPRSHQTDPKPRKPKTCMEVCMVDDISQGKENISIRAMNGVDDDKPPPFTYVTSIVYPHWFQQIEPDGCDCVDGCSDLHQCSCAVKNGGEIPYNENGRIIISKPRVHECGPSCKCPPTCMNRVGQRGSRYQLEIFKTEKRGWGVRSRDFIPSGGFICEYIGEFLRDDEADLRIGDDEYLFDIFNNRGQRAGGFAIDAAVYGNVGRFINHSCSPNLFAQNVYFDHGDKRMPHIMFFAAKKIHPLQELSYDYNYKLGKVCDANGNVKTKDCYCGSSKCIGRLY